LIELKVIKKELIFKFPSGTSRGVMLKKPSWFFVLKDFVNKGKISIGECGLLPGLSFDDKPGYEDKLKEILNLVNSTGNLNQDFDLIKFPSIRFGMEMLKKDYFAREEKIFFETEFTKGGYSIPINGLIWMGDKRFMFDQIKSKIEEGWGCIKIKIGAIDFDEEISLLKYIRKQFTKEEIELRVDANGAFALNDALEKLKILSDYDLHSIEQPVKAGQINAMAQLCELSPLAIALDEELIGVNERNDKKLLLETIKPQYIILKPSLTGGWEASNEWIDIARSLDIGYWATSALESNIGLNAIAQWTATLERDIIHGLGTGKLYTNNIASPLVVNKGFLSYEKHKEWGYFGVTV